MNTEKCTLSGQSQDIIAIVIISNNSSESNCNTVTIIIVQVTHMNWNTGSKGSFYIQCTDRLDPIRGSSFRPSTHFQFSTQTLLRIMCCCMHDRSLQLFPIESSYASVLLWGSAMLCCVIKVLIDVFFVYLCLLHVFPWVQDLFILALYHTIRLQRLSYRINATVVLHQRR